MYKVIAKRGIWKKDKLILESRVEFIEESELNYDKYYLKILSEFRDWVLSVKEISNVN